MSVPNFTAGLRSLDYLDTSAVPVATVNSPAGALKFLMYGEYTEFRIRTLLTKEVETIAWISKMSAENVLWDIGANIGLYSVFAGNCGLNVFAFEPSPTNFWLLNQNVALNNLASVKCLPLAVAGGTEIVNFTVDLSPAAAGTNQISDKSSGTLVQAYSINDLVQSAACSWPNHLKIDVDGIELDILKSAESVLSSDRLTSVMCEVDESDASSLTNIHSLLNSFGFNSVTTRHAPYFDDNYYLPRANHLFERSL